MAIPDSQLETWSHQGTVPQSRDTYATVKRALEAVTTKYADKSYEVFLQGSYCNDTNISAESDVDVVIRLNASYNYSLAALNAQEQTNFNGAFVQATYLYPEFKADVVAALGSSFSNAVHPGPNAIKIDAGGSRRSADVLAALDFRNYSGFPTGTNGIFPHGISFVNGSGERIVNYPKLHSQNCTMKHQTTKSMFKPMVRILKNARSKMESEGLLTEGVAPSYYLEGMLYNVPNEKLAGSYGAAMISTINWIFEADRSKFRCANEQSNLLGTSATSWPTANCDTFLNALAKLWNAW